jgi:phospholipase/lecithinase/hemolysin
VSKVLVNTAPPFGCQPFRAWNYNYAHCDALGNTVSDLHNAALRRRLRDLDDVMVLDVHGAFGDVVRSRYSPCCAETSGTGDGYCGQEDGMGMPLYSLCPDPDNFFYWDVMHPTQAAWEAVMGNLQPAIQDFLAY